MIIYTSPINKTSTIISEFKKLGYTIVADPSLYDTNIGSILSTILEEHEFIALIRRKHTTELASISKIDDIPEHFVEVANGQVATSSERHISALVFESLQRGRINNLPLLAEFAEEAEDATETDLEPDDIILMEKKKCKDG